MDDVMKECALCKQKKKLQRSHIIPKFVAKWIKDTSATGLLRGVEDRNKRLQDLPKMELLCSDCESLISKHESYFASKIFYPFINNKITEFNYTDQLQKFIISISWRILCIALEDQTKEDPWINDYSIQAKEYWRRILLGEIKHDKKFEHHMIFLDYIKASKDVPEDFNWYSLRGSDATIVSNEDTVFCYIHLPWMIMISTIHPRKNSKWINTRILEKGLLTRGGIVDDPQFGDFLIQRVKFAMNIKKQGDPRIIKSTIKNWDRLLLSESLQTFLSEEKRKRNRNLPDSLLNIIELLEGIQINTNISETQIRHLSLIYNFIADRLSKVSTQEANLFEREVRKMIFNTNITKPDQNLIITMNGVYIEYSINYCESKIEQNKIITSKMDKKIKLNSFEYDYYLFISYNPLEIESKYEMGAFVGNIDSINERNEFNY